MNTYKARAAKLKSFFNQAPSRVKEYKGLAMSEGSPRAVLNAILSEDRNFLDRNHISPDSFLSSLESYFGV